MVPRILEHVARMNRHQCDGLRDVERGATAKADHRVGAVGAIRISTRAHLRRYGVALDARIHAGIEPRKRAEELGEHRKRGDSLVGNDERAPASRFREVRRNELSRPRTEVDRRRESKLVDRHQMISKYRFSSQSVTASWNWRHSHSRVRTKCSTNVSPKSSRAAFERLRFSVACIRLRGRRGIFAALAASPASGASLSLSFFSIPHSPAPTSAANARYGL